MWCARLICIIVIVFVVAVNQAKAALSMEQIQKTAQTLRNTCINKINADPEIVAGIQKGEFPDNESLKCYTLCIMKAMRTFKNGRIDITMMIKQLDLLMPPDMATPLKETSITCGNEPPASDDCETALQFVKCSYQTDAEHFFFP
ncbi:Obp5 [Eciton burchellii]|nr:Obp5 [Eciton burchellii]